MGFNNTKAKLAQRGFTIVELLIVIVVIGILAAITLVSYNGITTRANAASAKAAAATVQKKAELYQADSGTGRYPVTAAEMTGAASTTSYYIAAGSSAEPVLVYGTALATAVSPATAITASNGTSRVLVRKCAATTAANQAAITSSNISGLEIVHWDYQNGVATGVVVPVGNTTSCPTS